VFTGLIEELGRVASVERSADGARLRIEASFASELHDGDSIAVNGVCLTATDSGGGAFSAEAMNETLARTTLSALEPGGAVNLELPLRAGDRLGGHVVQGHVDGIGTIAERRDDGFAVRMRIDAPDEVLRYVVEKGSIAVDGVSLTVAELDGGSFTVSLIPETLERTTLGSTRPPNPVNLEVDVLAKYVEKAVRR
jgi:riboflavin synthase